MDEITPVDVKPKDPPDEHAEPGPPEVDAVPIIGTGVFRAELDSATGATTYVEMTEDEVADAAVERAAIAAERAKRADDAAVAAVARDADVTTVKARAATDEDFAALARLAGVDLKDNGGL